MFRLSGCWADPPKNPINLLSRGQTSTTLCPCVNPDGEGGGWLTARAGWQGAGGDKGWGRGSGAGQQLDELELLGEPDPIGHRDPGQVPMPTVPVPQGRRCGTEGGGEEVGAMIRVFMVRFPDTKISGNGPLGVKNI